MKRFLALALPLILAACSSSNSMVSDIQPGDAEAAIAKHNHDLMLGAVGGNPSFVDAYYAPDAVFLPPNAPALKGREAIRQMWTGMVGSGTFDLKLTPDSVMQSCDMATEIGHYDLTFTPKTAGGSVDHDTGKYVVTWKKIDGKWQAVSDMYNSSNPLPAAH
jgi:ketosteroid isomerase-like protein